MQISKIFFCESRDAKFKKWLHDQDKDLDNVRDILIFIPVIQPVTCKIKNLT